MQPHGERRDGDRQSRPRSPSSGRSLPERSQAPVVRSQLSQLSDRRGRCLGTGGERHRHRKRQRHGQHRGAFGAGAPASMSRHGVRETIGRASPRRSRSTASSSPVAEKHQLVLAHGNGPQVGLLALQASAYKDVEPYPLDVLGAQTQGMIGYMIEQELGNLLPYECRLPPC